MLHRHRRKTLVVNATEPTPMTNAVKTLPTAPAAPAVATNTPEAAPIPLAIGAAMARETMNVNNRLAQEFLG